jgi:phosphotriesterase-related protein
MLINSVTGPVDTDSLGPTLVHEHISCADWSLRANLGPAFFDFDAVVEAATALFASVRDRCGVKTIVDGTPINLGRDVRLIEAVAARTGLTFIVSSGLYWHAEPWMVLCGEDRIHDLLLAECRRGVGDTGILPGIMKTAVDADGLTPVVRKAMTAVARVAAETGLPVFCHHAVGNRNGHDILDIFESYGVPLSRFILGHSGDTDDLDYLEPLLQRGCYLGMDRFGYCDLLLSLDRRVATIAALWRKGYGDQLMLSHDLVADGVASGSWDGFADSVPIKRPYADYTYLYETVFPALRAAGVPQNDLDSMMTNNPRRLFEA